MRRRAQVAGVTPSFGRQYATIYDSLYGSKNYTGEVDCIERILLRHLAGPRFRILDLGCGTGGHSIPLARRGHDVTGVDRSPEMLAQALVKSRLLESSVRLEFHEVDIRHLDLKRQFDAVLMMFTVLGYQHSADDLAAALSVVQRQLAPDGIFIFDVWNGLAVLEQGLSQRTLEVRRGAERIIRRSSAKIVDSANHLCDVHFDITHYDADGDERVWQEIHTLRYFFPQELPALLSARGMDLIELKSFPDDGPLDSHTWTIIGTARRR